MSILATLLSGSLSATPPASNDYWYQPVGLDTSSGTRITVDAAMRVSAVMACVKILAETLASLPLILYQELQRDNKQRAPEHPLYDVLHNTPNRWQTAFEFFEMMQGHLALRGNAIAQIVPGPRAAVDQLIPLHPDQVSVERLVTGRLRYKLRLLDGTVRYLTQDEVFHVRGLSGDGLVGISPITYAAESVGVSLAVERFASKFFGQGARLGNVLEHPGVMSPEAQKRFQSSLQAEYAGADNAHKTLILEEGMKWQQMAVKPEEAQFLETRKYQSVDIARIFRIPPHMIGELDRATFSNIEQQSLEFVIYTMRPWFARWEQAIKRDLITDDGYYSEFLVDALLRGDTKSRYEAYASAINTGWMERNEVRRLENMNPDPRLEGFLTPLNMSNSAAKSPVKQLEQEDANAYAVLIEDVASRIANAEIREIAKRIDKAGEDRERFNVWVASYSENHWQYVSKSLKPLLQTWKQAGHYLDATELLNTIAVGPANAFTNKLVEPAKVMSNWKDNRAQDIAAAIQLSLNGSGDNDSN